MSCTPEAIRKDRALIMRSAGIEADRKEESIMYKVYLIFYVW